MAKVTKAMMVAEMEAIKNEAQALTDKNPELREWSVCTHALWNTSRKSDVKVASVEKSLINARRLLDNARKGIAGKSGR